MFGESILDQGHDEQKQGGEKEHREVWGNGKQCRVAGGQSARCGEEGSRVMCETDCAGLYKLYQGVWECFKQLSK